MFFISHLVIDAGIPAGKKTSIALGNFDGLHRGHIAVIGFAAALADRGMVPIVLRFSVHPQKALRGFSPPYILSESEQLRRISLLGAKCAYLDFLSVRDLTEREFVEEVLIGELNAGALSCGYNYRFGKNASGDADKLRKLCGEYGLSLTVSEEVDYLGVPVSSTAVRKALLEGDIHMANGMLGYEYCYDYTVVGGDRRGRLLGSPTINQFFPDGALVPKYGVYASRVTVDGVDYAGVTNIGVRPTVDGAHPRSETYIENFSGDLYGRNPKVALTDYLRPEIRFESLDELKVQISRDAEKAAELFAAHISEGR